MRKVEYYKTAKKVNEQLEYLEINKRVVFNQVNRQTAKDVLFRCNYINVISPYKHHFARLDNSRNVVKIDNKHVYDRDVDFNEYYTKFKHEREKYPIIVTNILYFEMHFKSILANRVLTTIYITNSDKLLEFINQLYINVDGLNEDLKKRKMHMKLQLDSLKLDVTKYADVFCFFDRMSLGTLLTVYTCLNAAIQIQIFQDLKKYELTFNVNNIGHFINKVFCLVAIRNCVMHGNSLEILVRFYNAKDHTLRRITDKKRYISMIQYLSIEKPHEIS